MKGDIIMEAKEIKKCINQISDNELETILNSENNISGGLSQNGVRTFEILRGFAALGVVSSLIGYEIGLSDMKKQLRENDSQGLLKKNYEEGYKEGKQGFYEVLHNYKGKKTAY